MGCARRNRQTHPPLSGDFDRIAGWSQHPAAGGVCPNS
ncbi:hypothetical protein AFNJKBDN_CDS0042 [Halorubrum virus V_ICIS4]|nr:hypothetical protein AFNJKBDN_CDS0042 [Halorubrum virus V_ICIS4]